METLVKKIEAKLERFCGNKNYKFIGYLQLRNIYFAFESENYYVLVSNRFLEERMDSLKFVTFYNKQIVSSFLTFLIQSYYISQINAIITTIHDVEEKLRNPSSNLEATLFKTIKENYATPNKGTGYKFHYIIQNLIVLSTILHMGSVKKEKRKFYFIIPLFESHCKIRDEKP